MPELNYPIHTERLHLRPFEADDLEAMYVYHANPDVCRYLPWDVRNKEETQNALERRFQQTQLRQEGDVLNLAVVLTETAQVIGEAILFWRSEQHEQAELGYVFNPDFAGQGYATETATTMLKLGFESFNFHRIYCRCDARNVASYKLMERLNMRREAHFVHNEMFKGQWGEELVYALLASEWQAQQNAQVT